MTLGIISMEFTVNKLNWKMEYIDSENVQVNNEDGCFLGVTDFIDQRIIIRKGLTEQMTRQTVIHELCHCFLMSYAVHTSCYDEEQVCNFLGAYIDDILELTNKFMKKGVKDSVEGK